MPANPNTGTGYVDWSSYVGANQGNVAQDRAQVSNYLGNQQAQLQNTPAGSDFNTLQTNLGTDVNALQDPSGFSQVLAQAKANYNPLNPNQKYSSAAADPFSSALEGQNAGGLYTGPDPYGIQPQAPPAAAPAKDPGGNDFGPPSNRPEGPSDTGSQTKQDAGPNWGIYNHPNTQFGKKTPPPPKAAPNPAFPNAQPFNPRKRP